jgi:hypothetical protein
MKTKRVVILMAVIANMTFVAAQFPYPGIDPGKALLRTVQGKSITLENNVIRIEFIVDRKKIAVSRFEDKQRSSQLIAENLPLFELTLQNGNVITSADFIPESFPEASDSKADPGSRIFSDRVQGKKITATLKNPENGISLLWEANLKDGSNYIRQIFRFEAKDNNKIAGITPVKIPVYTGARKEGTVDGSPIVCKNMFFALEYPLSKVQQQGEYITARLERLMPSVSTVWGVTPADQLRRGFLCYIERERAHPYHQVLHYNSWYDISWSDRKFNESECLDRIKCFGDNLIKARKVPMKGFLFDDGWDDNRTLWKFHPGFPDGFDAVKKAAQSYNSEIGVWLSPFGGYSIAKEARLEYGRKQNPPFETNSQGFALAGPVYYKRFSEVTANFIKDYNISMFKFDGVGRGSGAGIEYQKDVEAFLRLLTDLLGIRSDLYLSLTTGTWPSVFWLKYGDNIWRGGHDTYMMGEGSKRQQWITYRDADVYKNVVKRGPLFPLNSLMLCGICIADNGEPALFEMNDKDISDEIWSFFATGTNLQELYINPHKLSSKNWDCLAEAAGWAKENEQIMVDTHWTGGDPAKGEVYGYASWSPDKALFSLRNPSSVEKTFEISTQKLFEIPVNAKDEFIFYDAVKGSSAGTKQPQAQGKTFKITLSPFEVRVFEAVPGS